MKAVFGLDALEPPPGGAVVTVGTFDGVHLGHRSLIMQTLERAESLQATGVALTWDRHPAMTLRPDKAPPLLSSTERKVELLGDSGIPMTAVLAFDEGFSHKSPEDFVTDVLVRGLGARAVLVGHDWRFGHRAAGTVELLTNMGANLGFEVHGIELQTIGGEPVSSSRIRKAIAAGEMEEARALLGRPFDIDGVVIRGAARGKDLGFPTANLDIDPVLARPPLGVYAGIATVGDLTRTAAISVGVNPTFGGEEGKSPVSVEAYLLDFDGDLYGQTMRLSFWARLRDELRFESVDDLVAQMHEDVTRTRALIPVSS